MESSLYSANFPGNNPTPSNSNNQPMQKLTISSRNKMAATKKGSKAAGKSRTAGGTKGGAKATDTTAKGGVKGTTSRKNRNPTKQSLTVKLTTSSGRQTKAKQDARFAYGEELEEAINEYDDAAGNSSEYFDEPSPPPAIHAKAKTARRAPVVVAPVYNPTHSVDNLSGRPSYQHGNEMFPADIDRNIEALTEILRTSEQLARILGTQEKIPVELPDILDNEHPENGKPWTAKELIHLYITCYHSQDYHSCDLIADTWIRAFQKLDLNPRLKIWQVNKSKYFNPSLSQPVYDQDPVLNYDVTDFDQDRLNELYYHTAPDCGARLLWADAMALCGSRLEQQMEKSEKITKKEWHKDIVWNVMRTSLRLVRVRRTLKIEEKTRGAWCQRYHEHGKQGLKCYLEVRAEQDQAEQDQEEAEVEGMSPAAEAVNSRRSAVQTANKGKHKVVEFEAEDVFDPASATPKRVKLLKGSAGESSEEE